MVLNWENKETKHCFYLQEENKCERKVNKQLAKKCTIILDISNKAWYLNKTSWK